MSKNLRLPVALGIGVVALIAGISFWMTHSNPKAGEVQPADAVTADTPSEPATPGAPSRQGSAPVRAIDGPDPFEVLAAEDAEAIRIAEAGETKLRARYELETVDSAWAVSKQRALERASLSPQIEQLNAQPLSINSQCRTTVCMITATFPSRVAAEDWFTLYTLNAGPEMTASSSRSTVNADGTVQLQIYGQTR